MARGSEVVSARLSLGVGELDRSRLLRHFRQILELSARKSFKPRFQHGYCTLEQHFSVRSSVNESYAPFTVLVTPYTSTQRGNVTYA